MSSPMYLTNILLLWTFYPWQCMPKTLSGIYVGRCKWISLANVKRYLLSQSHWEFAHGGFPKHWLIPNVKFAYLFDHPRHTSSKKIPTTQYGQSILHGFQASRVQIWPLFFRRTLFLHGADPQFVWACSLPSLILNHSVILAIATYM